MTQSGRSQPADVYPRRLVLALFVGTAAFFAAGLLPFEATAPVFAARMAAGITGFVAVCWLGNAVPLAAASLMPLALMPMFGVSPITRCATAYAHPIIWMFFGGFVLALGIERWGLHRRLALAIIGRVGVEPSRLVLGFMVAAAFLSMWLNNTSTTLLLLPIALALIKAVSDAGAVPGDGEGNFAFALLLGVAYACSIGGMGTPIGTPPNALFFSQYSLFEARGAPTLGFLRWLMVGLPLVVVMLPLVWLLLTRVLAPLPPGTTEAKAILDAEAAALPPMDAAQRRMLGLFGLAALLWVTRNDFQLGELLTLPGWWRLLPVTDGDHIGDGAVAVFVAILSFIVPSGRRRGEAIMNWQTARELPWEILLLIGGGIAIANAFMDTGLAKSIGASLLPLANTLHPLAMLMLVCTLMTFLTEVTSNTATTALLLPVLSSMSVSAGMDPRLLMLGATFSASCAFMLPIATPPNAIVFSSGRIHMGRMAAAGLWINLLGVLVITAVVWLIAVPVMGIEVGTLPPWLADAAQAP